MAQEISNVLVFYLCKNITNISFVIILLTQKCELPFVIEAWTMPTKIWKTSPSSKKLNWKKCK